MHRAILFPIASVLILTGLQAAAVSKKEGSLGNCPLDKTTFADRAGGEFSVTKVGSSHGQICQGIERLLDEDGNCPYGWTVLEGQLKQIDNSKSGRVWAILQIMPAAPCCGWLAHNDPAKVEAFKRSDFVWLEGKDVPRLKDLHLSSIDFHEPISNPEAREIFGNEKAPLRCTMEMAK